MGGQPTTQRANLNLDGKNYRALRRENRTVGLEDNIKILEVFKALF